MPLSSDDVASLTGAVRELESRSCAEVVIEIRARSGSYAMADARFGALVAFLGLLVLLFAPWSFHTWWVAVDVALLYAAAWALSRYSNPVRRLMSSRREREARVHSYSAAAYYERGVGNTRDETGVLVYLSLLERRIEILADRKVLASVPSLQWNQLVASARHIRADMPVLVDLLRDLTPLLACHLPVGDGDADELGNEPRFVSE